MVGVEFKGKNMLHYCRGVKWQQGFTAEIEVYLFNILDSLQGIYLGGLTVRKASYQLCSPRSFPGRGGYEFAFQ